MKATDIICACGHENVRSTNKTTFEITKETYLTRRGDCIIAVGANKGAADLNQKFKKFSQNENARIKIAVETDDQIEVVNAWGTRLLSFTHPTDMVIRKSNYVCNRTIAILADKSAQDFSRKLVEELRNPVLRVKITLTVETLI
jgi:hypothetical protein